MSELKISRRYAKALYDFAVEEKLVNEINNDMSLIYNSCIDNKELIHFLKSPVIRPKKKLEIIDLIFGSHINKISTNFIKIIATQRREFLLIQIAKQFIDMHKDALGIKVAFIKSAVALDDATKKHIVNLLEKQTGYKIQLDIIVKEELIGGMVLTLDNKEIDATIKSKLVRLKSEFDSNLYERKF